MTARTEAQAATAIRVADEVWIATALLHREHPERQDFTIREIVQRAAAEGLYGSMRPGIHVHAHSHCVANKPPMPTGYRMLYATGKSTRRLYREGDFAHPKRSGKITPQKAEVPIQYHPLLDWYEREYAAQRSDSKPWLQGILALRGFGKGIWGGENPDDYVRRLRDGWQ